jgi:hypothetical protein
MQAHRKLLFAGANITFMIVAYALAKIESHAAANACYSGPSTLPSLLATLLAIAACVKLQIETKKSGLLVYRILAAVLLAATLLAGGVIWLVANLNICF